MKLPAYYLIKIQGLIVSMNKELVDKLKKEFVYILGLFLLSILIFKFVFSKEQFIVVVKVLLGFFWLFVLPGFSLMYYWPSLSFLERFVIGIAVSLALIGTMSYYAGLMGLHTKYHAILLPIILLVFGSLIIWKKIKIQDNT